MPVRRCGHAVDFVREITNHEHQDWVRKDDLRTSSWGFECQTCGSRYLIALSAFWYQGGDRYSNALRDCAINSRRHDLLETVLGFDCTYCRATEGVRIETAQTAYDTSYPRTRFERILEPEPESPNIDLPMCRDCAADYHEYWTEMWDEYYRNMM